MLVVCQNLHPGGDTGGVVLSDFESHPLIGTEKGAIDRIKVELSQ